MIPSFVLFLFSCAADKSGDTDVEIIPFVCTESEAPCDLFCWDVYDGGYFEYAYQCKAEGDGETCIDAYKTYLGGEAGDQICAQCNREQGQEYSTISAGVCGLLGT
jgi:hypothetical protein